MNIAILDLFLRNVNCSEFSAKRVLEVSSKFVDGSVRPLIERFCNPREYVGVDIEPGKYVNVVLPAEKLVDYFGPEPFDIVISMEVPEHVFNWRLVVNNMKIVLKRGGYIHVTTRSKGFPYHTYPYNFWRYEAGDMIRIFKDFEIIRLEASWEAPGVFLKAKKPINWRPADLDNIELYSIILGKRPRNLVDLTEAPLVRRLMFMLCESKLKHFLPGVVVHMVARK